MQNKYEQIVLQEFIGGAKDGGIFQNVMGNLVSAFSDTGALGAFTDIFTGDRAAKQYTADPVGQRIYQLFVQPAVSSAKSGDLTKSFDLLSDGMDKLNFYIGSYKLNLRKYVNDPRLRNVIDKEEGYSWYPEQIIGMPSSKAFSRLSSLGKSGYERFPQAVEFQDSIKQGLAAICYGAQVIIGMRLDDILSDPELAEQVYIGIGRIIVKAEQLSSIGFTVRSPYLTYTTFDVEFELSDLISDVNKDSQNIISDLVEFMEFLRGAQTVMAKVKEQEKDSNQQQSGANIDLDKVTTEVLKKLAEMAEGESVQLVLTEEDLDEQSVVGNIAGYSLPLGTSNQDDPDKEMKDTIDATGWDDLDVSTANIAGDSKDSVKKGAKTLFKSREPRS